MDNKISKKQIIIGIIGGVVVGLLNGFFGGGGGMIVVPLLIFLLAQEEKKAHATAIFIILPLCITSSIVYLLNKTMEIETLSFVSIGVLAGGVIGAFLLNKMNNKVLRIVFSVVMVAAGVRLMVG